MGVPIQYVREPSALLPEVLENCTYLNFPWLKAVSIESNNMASCDQQAQVIFVSLIYFIYRGHA